MHHEPVFGQPHWMVIGPELLKPALGTAILQQRKVPFQRINQLQKVQFYILLYICPNDPIESFQGNFNVKICLLYLK